MSFPADGKEMTVVRVRDMMQIRRCRMVASPRVWADATRP